MNMPEDNYAADPASEAWDDRTRRVLGEEAVERLADASVLIVGVGGVGGYAAEMLVRSGVGKLTLIDADKVAESNINRQIIALRSTVGMPKSIIAAERLHDINPAASIDCLQMYLDPAQVDEILDAEFDFVLDCIDTVAPKAALLTRCLLRRVPVISSMGAGGRIDPTKVCYSDIWSTRDDGLARAVRHHLKKNGVRRSLMTVCSTEPVRKQSLMEINDTNKRTSYGSLAAIPSIFGIYMANYVIRKIGKV
ncbi:MAG: tRNA threonylcarbamoyladenosine dehydratase [Muribaculaceae bacterium]|nr:tRNA threonylcarbamoyladenosine dehydratase [Muribaculaceae bacterium]